MSTWQRLEELARGGGEIRVAVVGAGFMGRGLVHQLLKTPAMRPALVVNRSVERAVAAYRDAGLDGRVVVSDEPDELAEAIAERKPAVSPSPDVLARIPAIDVVVEATGAMAYGAHTVLSSLAAGKHVVSLNAELDATLGHLLHERARRHGVVYTIADGDQPGVLMRQLEFVRSLGLEVVAAVNCKRNLDRHQNPDDSRAYASRDGTSVHMTTAFGDGTKMQIENAVVANLTGLVPDTRGMHGVRTTLADAATDIVAAISTPGVVEYTLGGDFAGGVCVIGRSADAAMVQPYMRYSKMGEGPDYLFFRPYHLMHMEVPRTIAEVVLDGQGLGTPQGPPVAEVVAVAKRNLVAGERLDGIGGFACYGEVDIVGGAADLLPVGLAEHARLLQPVARDEPVPLSAVELDADAPVVALRREQDDMFVVARGA